MAENKEIAKRIKGLSKAVKHHHQIISKCDFFSLFGAEVKEVNKKINGVEVRGKCQTLLPPKERRALFWKLLNNLVRAKWQMELKPLRGNDYDLLLIEQKTKLTSKTAKKWNKWLFAWRDKKPAKTIFINT